MPTRETTRVVVIGGGYAGTLAASRLRLRADVDSQPREEGIEMTTQHEQDEAAIRRQIGKIIAGLRDKDLEMLRQPYAPDVVSFDVEPPLQHVGIAAKLNNWEKALAFFQDVRYEVRDLSLAVGEEVAYGYGFARLRGTLQNGTATSGMWVRATFCFRKTDDTWLIAHDQVSVPLDFPSGRGVADLEPWTARSSSTAPGGKPGHGEPAIRGHQ
jgi:ketosteroid isomerase-like protein